MLTNFKNLEGKTINKIWINEEESEIIFKCKNGNKYKMSHWQDCCETVYLEEIIGNLDNILGHKILNAELRQQKSETELYEHETWSFYIIETFRGSVTLRWYGTSNGYYSEEVDFELIEGGD